MRCYLDTEFIEDGTTILLLSIGVVREDGEEFYWETQDPPLHLASDWVAKNVIPHLTGPKKWLPRGQIASALIRFCGSNPQFWAYYADYDWVALCQLFGRMIDLPRGWPMLCLDLKQEMIQQGVEQHHVPQHIWAKDTGTEHDALADARWNKRLHEWIRGEIK